MKQIATAMAVRLVLVAIGVTIGGTAMADVVVKKIDYRVDGAPFEGMLVYDDSLTGARPGLLMIPNWMGPTDDAARKAARVAGNRYVVFVADMYGAAVRPQNQQQAAQAAGAVRSNRPLMRRRAAAALDVLRQQNPESEKLSIDTARLGAVGFCFGGSGVLELCLLYTSDAADE